MRTSAISVAILALMGSVSAYPAPQRESSSRRGRVHTRVVTKTVTSTVYHDITLTPTPTPTPTPPPAPAQPTTTTVVIVEPEPTPEPAPEPERAPQRQPEPEPEPAPAPAPAPAPEPEQPKPRPIENNIDEDEEEEEPPKQGGGNGGGSGGGAPSGFAAEILALHNQARAKHSAPPLVWDATVAAFAQSRSNTCVFAHASNLPYGENIAIGSNLGAARTMRMWYDQEEPEYNYNNPGFSDRTGHYTAVVWKSTSKLGCAVTDCGSKGNLIVCNYASAGNVSGRFPENVTSS